MISGLLFAASVDAAPNNRLLYSAQIALPGQKITDSGPSSETSGRTTFVLSSTGIDMRDAHKQMQMKLSRRMFIAHRDLFLIGESLAKRGLLKILGEPVRNPQSRLRTNVVITKGDALQYLNVEYLFERVPSEAMRKLAFGGVVAGFNKT